MIAWLSQNKMFAAAAALLLLALASALHVGQTLEAQLPRDSQAFEYPERLGPFQAIDHNGKRHRVRFEAQLTVLFVFAQGHLAASGLYEFEQRAPDTVRILGVALESDSPRRAVEDERVVVASREELLRLGIGAIPVIIAVGRGGSVKKVWAGTWDARTQQQLDKIARESRELR